MNDILVQKFIENFNMSMVAIDLIDLMLNVKVECLTNYIKEQFNKSFTYEELYNLFKDEIGNKEDLQLFLEDMGYDFVDLDELDEEEKEKYF